MSISFDKALGIHEDALRVRNSRAQLIANNLANADTPGYKARDIDFKHMLDNDFSTRLKTTNQQHIKLNQTDMMDTMYRVPMQASVDGNTVEEQVEISKFSENSMRYLASLRFLNDRFKGMMSAIRGE